MANTWDYAKKTLPWKDRQSMEGNALPYKEQQMFDLLNAVGADTDPTKYWQTRAGAPNSGYAPNTNPAPPPKQAMDVDASQRVPMANVPAWLGAPVKESFNAGAPDLEPNGDADTRFQKNRQMMKDYYSKVTAEPVSDVPRGSGLSRKNNQRMVRDDKAVRTESTFVTPEQWEGAQANFRSLPEIENIRQNQRDMEEMVRTGLQHSPAMPDLGVLKDFAKNISGGRVTMDGYNAPKPSMDAGTALAVLGNRGKIEQDILKQAADAIANQKSGTLLESYGSQGLLESGDAVADAQRYKPPVPRASTGKGYDPNKDIKELGKERSKYVAPILNGVTQLDEVFARAGWKGGLQEAQEQLASEGKLRHDVPGVGGVKSLVGSIAPALLSNEGSQLYATLKNMALAKLQARSGAQATEGEARKYLADFGLTPGAADPEVVRGIGRLLVDMKTTLKSDETRFDPRAVEIYSKRPGRIMSTDFDRFLVRQGADAAQKLMNKSSPVQGPPSPPNKTEKNADLDAIDKELAEIDAQLKAKKGGK